MVNGNQAKDNPPALFSRLGPYMLIEMLRPPLPNRGLTTLLRVEPKEKLKPAENE